jgi:hypothetical protein
LGKAQAGLFLEELILSKTIDKTGYKAYADFEYFAAYESSGSSGT